MEILLMKIKLKKIAQAIVKDVLMKGYYECINDYFLLANGKCK